jgi:aminotransferase
MEQKDLEEIAEVVCENDLFVLSDEIYSELTYGGLSHVSIASLPDMRERTVVINGFSKSYAMTGWRLGYALGPAPIISQILKLHQYGIMSAPTTAQYAAIEALRNGDRDVLKMRDEYDMRRRLVVDSFNAMGLTCFEPFGAFYVFPCIKSTGLSSEEFCTRLIMDKHIAVVPGNAFGECGEGFVRVSYSYSIKHLKIALERIREFLQELNYGS